GSAVYGFAGFRMAVDGIFDRLAGRIHPMSLSKCIHLYNQRNEVRFAPVVSQEDFRKAIQDILISGIERWKVDEGGVELNKRIQAQFSRGEDITQVILHLLIHSHLQEQGFDGRRISLTREAQKTDGQRADLMIQYGLFSPIIIEVKLSHNPEISVSKKSNQPNKAAVDYAPKLTKYVNGFGCKHGFLLILGVLKEARLAPIQVDALKRMYQEKEPRMQVIYQDLFET
ncbi:MAG: hypothetical protein AAF399_23710, partial [Bacteroidota bacterium]